MTHLARWSLLVVLTAAVIAALTVLGVPSAALFAALVAGIALALVSAAPPRVSKRLVVGAQGVLGVFIGTMVHEDSLGALGSHWPAVLAVVVATLLVSVGAGALMGLHRDVTPLTGALALVAGGASGLVAIARELGGDDRVVAVVQYLRVGIVTAMMPIVVTIIFRPDRASPAPVGAADAQPPWYVCLAAVAVIAVCGTVLGWLARLPGAGLLGPMALTIAVELTGLSNGLLVPPGLVQIGYAVIGWQAGIAFTRDSLRAMGGALPLALALIGVLSVASAGLGMVLARVAGLTPLEGYLATSPGGVYAVLATAAEAGCNVTFVIATQVLRILVMLFAAPALARVMAVLAARRRHSREITAASRDPIAVAD
jgi:uncharacterized protein